MRGPFAQHGLPAAGLARPGRIRVFAVDDPDFVRQLIGQHGGIVGAVDQQIGGVEIDPDIRLADILDRLLETGDVFGSRFEQEFLAVGGGESDQQFQVGDEPIIKLIAFLRDESDVAGDITDAVAFRPVHLAAGEDHAFGAGFFRDQADPLARMFPVLIRVGHEHRRHGDAVFPEELEKRVGRIQCGFARRQPVFINASDLERIQADLMVISDPAFIDAAAAQQCSNGRHVHGAKSPFFRFRTVDGRPVCFAHNIEYHLLECNARNSQIHILFS